jgi:hypothetical protein
MSCAAAQRLVACQGSRTPMSTRVLPPFERTRQNVRAADAETSLDKKIHPYALVELTSCRGSPP